MWRSDSGISMIFVYSQLKQKTQNKAIIKY